MLKSSKTTSDIEPNKDTRVNGYKCTCTYFGCGRELSLIESLCGNKCIAHQRPNINIIRNLIFDRITQKKI